MGSLMDMHTCTDTCTHSKQGVHLERGDWIVYTGPHMFVDNYAKGVEQM